MSLAWHIPSSCCKPRTLLNQMYLKNSAQTKAYAASSSLPMSLHTPPPPGSQKDHHPSLQMPAPQGRPPRSRQEEQLPISSTLG